MEHSAYKCLLPNMRVEEGFGYSEEMWHFRKMLQPCAAYRLHNLVPRQSFNNLRYLAIDRNLRFMLVGIES